MKTQSENSSQIRKLANQLSVLKLHRFMFAAATDWAIIGSAVLLSEYSGSFALYLGACAVIAARQHALMVLTHEGVHHRIAASPVLNDLVSDVLAAYPVFFDTQIWRMTHFPHHQFLNSDKDPDWTKKSPYPEWHFPKTKAQLLRFAARYVLTSGPMEWTGAIRHFSGLRAAQLRNRRFGGRLVRKLVFWTVVFGLLGSAKRFDLLLYYWLVPFFVFFPALQRVRSIAEHFGLKNEHELNQSRDVVGPAWESFFFGPHNVNLHLVHHLYSAVPFYNLPKLHRALAAMPEFQAMAHQNTSYLWPSRHSVLSDIVAKESPQADLAAEAA